MAKHMLLSICNFYYYYFLLQSNWKSIEICILKCYLFKYNSVIYQKKKKMFKYVKDTFKRVESRKENGGRVRDYRKGLGLSQSVPQHIYF